VRNLIAATKTLQMRSLLIFIFCMTSLHIDAQDTQAAFDGHKWEAPYNLPIPQGWAIERFLIPISFAPQIPYKGIEDIRFSPGWAKVKNDEYWTYAFLWWLDSSPKIDAGIIAKNLKAYYTGLIRSNTNDSTTSSGKSIPVTTSFKKSTTGKDDLETYTGTVEMLDYMQKQPIILNCIVRLKFCKELKKAILFYELSPKPFTHSNWASLDKLWSDFTCKRNG
jgi:hypothetical protein